MHAKLCVKAVMLLLLLASPAVFADIYAGPDSPGEPLAEPFAPLSAPVVEPVAAPVEEPVAAPVAEPVAEPIAAPVAEPVAAPVAEPVAAPVAAEPVSGPVATPSSTPVEGPVASEPQTVPESEPVAAPETAPTTPPVTAPTAPEVDVTPLTMCWEPVENTTTFIVYFGYNSASTVVVNITAGADNQVTGSSGAVTVPTSFAPGLHSYSLTVEDVPAGALVVWTLDGRTATVDTNDAAHACSRSGSANLTVRLYYSDPIPVNQDVFKQSVRDKLEVDFGVPDYRSFATIVDLSSARKAALADTFAVEIGITPASGSEPSAISLVARIAQADPSQLVAGGLTPSRVASVDNALVVPPASPQEPPTPIPSPSGLSDGSIAGIVIGSVAAALILVFVVYIIVARVTEKRSGTTASVPASTRAASASKAASVAAANKKVSNTEEDEEDEEEDSEEEDSEEEEEDSEEEESEEEESEEEESEEEESEEEESEEEESEEEESGEEEESSEGSEESS